MKNSVILIPSYEPDELLINTIDSLLKEDFPIVVVNDGSKSEYDAVFDQIKDKVHYFKYSENHGKGYAMKYGFKKIQEILPEAKYVITADGDGQHATKDIIRVHDQLNKDNILVFGVRQFDKKVPFRSRFGNDFSKTTRTLLTKTYIEDDQCGLRGFPVSYIPELLSIKGNRYEYEMNEMVLFQMKQYPIITIPIETVYLDNNSRSHFAPFKDTFRIQCNIFSHSYISLICVVLNIVGLMLLTTLCDINMFEKYAAFTYAGSAVLCFLFTGTFYPTNKFGKLVLKTLLFAGIELGVSTGILSIVKAININALVYFIPFVVFGCYFFNILLAYIFRKLFPTY